MLLQFLRQASSFLGCARNDFIRGGDVVRIIICITVISAIIPPESL